MGERAPGPAAGSKEPDMPGQLSLCWSSLRGNHHDDEQCPRDDKQYELEFSHVPDWDDDGAGR